MKGSQVAIVGVGETPYVRASEATPIEMLAAASRQAIADAGLKISDIDGVIGNRMNHSTDDLCFNLGVTQHVFTATTDVAGGTATTGSAVMLAQLAVEAGLANYVLVPYGISCSAPGGPYMFHGREPLKADLEMPLGYYGQPSYFAAMANRYRHEFGLTEEELASVALTFRRWATMNPNAQKQSPMDFEGYQKSPMISSPLRAADCCLMTDGAGAYIVTSTERARDLKQPPINVAAVAMHSNPWPQSMVLTQNPDLLELPGRGSAAKAYAMAGMSAKDLDLAQVYDCFAISAILQTEMLGICERGEGAKFFHAGHAMPGGKLPINTSGGHMSGGYVPGINLLIEAVRQLRHERGEAQVPDAKVCAVAGLGGNSHSTTILTRA
ncbi:thiolase family protein [Spongiibacter tropicus]|uniref:thiolase family protein n=1 Tax=Spongiibacter tropicus TaxID=454602 RepID=UPI0003B791A3|nr:thiolase family protein [Spongiibacter tropicus]